MFQKLRLRDEGTHIRNMNVCIMYVKISAFYCKNQAEKKSKKCRQSNEYFNVKTGGVYMHLPSGFNELQRKQHASECVLCIYIYIYI